MIGRAGLDSVSVPVARARSGGPSGYTPSKRLRSALRGLRWAIARDPRPPVIAGAAPGAEFESHNTAQRAYYSRPKPGMAPRPSRYLARHVDELAAFAGLEAGARVLEVGPGQGRYTLPLADRGLRVEALELAPAMVEALEAARGERDIEVHEGDVISPPPELNGGFDAVIGFFALHHMHDVAGCLRSMAELLAPGGVLAFLEPNPYNPLYYVQMAIKPEMTWKGDRGMLGMRPAPLLGALADAGLEDRRFERFGFFPPFVADRPRAAGIERAIERVPPIRPLLPFQLVGGRRPA
jgi:SAM-dependent methyltransferase